MKLNLVERDIKDREEALRRCKYNLSCLRKSPRVASYRESIRLMSQEVFYLQDQLDHFYSILAVLKEEQGSTDEMLPRV